MYRVTPLWLIVVCFGVFGCAASADDITPLIETIRAKHSMPAMAAAVIRSDGLVVAGVSGKRQQSFDIPVELDDRFHIGSCTKAFTSTVAGILIEKGMLKWETSIGEVFAELSEDFLPAYREVTLEQLLSHRAGLMTFLRPGPKENEIAGKLEGTPSVQRMEFMKRLLKQEPLSKAGSTYEYSNAGYAIVASMMEKVSGKTWQELITEHIFKPLEMSFAGFGMPATLDKENQPWGHFQRDQEIIQVPPVSMLPPILESSGDINCSIRDFAKFAQTHLRGLRGDDKSILKTETARHLHTPILNNYAMGWFDAELGGEIATAHNGSAGVFFAFMAIWHERDLAIVVTANVGSGEEACVELLEELHAAYAEANTSQPSEDKSDK